MGLYLTALNGPQKGHKFPLAHGVTIGRFNTSIALDDKRVSALHAKIEINKSGYLVLVDQGSSNGTKVNGKKHGRILLRPGLSFQIGDTIFAVQGKDEGDELGSSKSNSPREPKLPPVPAARRSAPSRPPTPSGPPPSSSASQSQGPALKPNASAPTPPPPNESPVVTKRWNEVLEEFARESAVNIENQPKGLQFFNPVLELVFSAGVQAKESFVLGYGPREIGPKSMEFPIYEKDVPSICFKISPSIKGPLFETEHPETVRVNDVAEKSRHLAVGDVIAFGGTRIEVRTIG